MCTEYIDKLTDFWNFKCLLVFHEFGYIKRLWKFQQFMDMSRMYVNNLWICQKVMDLEIFQSLF